MLENLKWLNETGLDELELVGGKNASLGEMIKNLNGLGIKVPFGFVVTSAAYDLFMNSNKLYERIGEIINDLQFEENEKDPNEENGCI